MDQNDSALNCSAEPEGIDQQGGADENLFPWRYLYYKRHDRLFSLIEAI